MEAMEEIAEIEAEAIPPLDQARAKHRSFGGDNIQISTSGDKRISGKE